MAKPRSRRPATEAASPWRGLGLRRAALATLAACLVSWLGQWTVPGDPALRPRPGGPTVEIWALDNGFHADLSLPRERLDDGDGPLARAVRRLPPGDWINVGWGDARFYADARPIHHRLPDGARAFLWPGNASVLHLAPLSRSPEQAYADGVAHRVVLSPQGFDRLRRRLEASLTTDEGHPVAGPPAQVGDGRFYMSQETFWVGHLCNHWVGELLHAGGLSFRPARATVSVEIVRMAETSELDSATPAH